MTCKTGYSAIPAITSLLLALLASVQAAAQNTYDLDTLADGQLILNLNATEQISVDQDTLNVFMQYTAQGRNTVALQDEVNRVLREARDILDDTDNIVFSIQQYNVYPIDRGNTSSPTWRAQQSIQMQSMNSESLLVVTARLQDTGLTISNMNYSLSSERYEAVSDSLMAAALAKLQARADEVARLLDKDSARLIEINLNGSQDFGTPMFGLSEMRLSAAAGAMSVPVAEPSRAQVTFTVNARALLSP